MLSNPNHYILHIIYSIWTKKYSLQHHCQDLGQYICIFGVLYSAQQPGAVLCWYVGNLLKMRLLCCFYEHQKWQKWSSVMDRFLFSENISYGECPALGLVRDGRRMEIPLHNSRTNHSNTLQNGDIYMLLTTTTYLDHRERCRESW